MPIFGFIKDVREANEILHPEGNKVKIGEDFDPRFPNLNNHLRKCWDYYVTFHRCLKKYEGDAAAQKPCYYFLKLYNPPRCPPDQVAKWDEQREKGIFPGHI